MTIRLLPVLALFAAAPSPVFCQEDKPQEPAPAAAETEKRRLVFHRPETVGAKYEYTGKGTSTRSSDYYFDDDVRPGGNESIETTLTGVLEVTDVTPKVGDVAGYKFTVKKMTLTDGSGEDAGLEPGTVITAKVAKFKTTFVVNGGEVKDELEAGLRFALPEYTGVDEDLNGVLAPKDPVAKGDKWRKDGAGLKEFIEKYREGIEVDAAKSSAESHYRGPGNTGGMETDLVAVSQTIVLSKLAGLPEDAKLIKAENTNEITYAISRDVKISAVRETRVVSEEKVRLSGKTEGQAYEVEIKSHSERHQSLKPVK